MSDAPIITEKDAYEQLGNGLLALVGVAMTSAAPLAGAVALAGPLVALVFGRGMHRFAQKRLPEFAGGFLSAFDPVPEEAAKKVNAAEQKDSESLDDVTMRAFRLMMDAVDDEVVPILGYMAGRYTFEQKKPDAFFRGLGRVLSDLEPGELSQLRLLVKGVTSTPRDPATLVAVAVISKASDDNDEADQVKLSVGESKAVLSGLPSAQRLFVMLKREHLALDQGAARGFRQEMGDEAIRMTFSAAEQIAAVIFVR